MELEGVPPIECGHKTWELGCERCFTEATQMALGKARLDGIKDQTTGAAMMLFHMLIVLQGMEMQLEPMLRSLDLRDVEVGREVIGTLKSLVEYIRLISTDDNKIRATIIETAQAAAAAASRAKVQAEPVQSVEDIKPLVTLTDL